MYIIFIYEQTADASRLNIDFRVGVFKLSQRKGRRLGGTRFMYTRDSAARGGLNGCGCESTGEADRQALGLRWMNERTAAVVVWQVFVDAETNVSIPAGVPLFHLPLCLCAHIINTCAYLYMYMVQRGCNVGVYTGWF